MNRPSLIPGLTAALLAVLPSLPAAAAGVQPGYVTAVLIGQQDGAGILPAFNKVPGTNTGNLDVALPLGVITRGQAYVVMVMSQIGTFTGTCKTSFSLTQTVGTTTTTLSSGAIKAYACSTGQIYGWALNTTAIGGSAGPATLTGEAVLGSQHIKLVVPVTLQ